MTKHINSSEALPSEANLWLMPHTQTAIKETKTICIYPETSIENSDTIPFTIPALPKCQLENIKVVAEIKVTTQAGANLAATANVSVAPHLAAVLFQNVVASIGNQQITQSFDNAYFAFKFWETMLHTVQPKGDKSAIEQEERFLLDDTANKTGSENVTFYELADGAAPVNKNGKKRADWIRNGNIIRTVSNLNIPLFTQGQLLPPNLEIKLNLVKNDPGFILLSAADDTSKVNFKNVYLKCRFKQPTDVVLNLMEERLAKSNAIYHADRKLLSYHPISANVTDVTIDNLFNGPLPYFFMIGVQTRGALARDRSKNPCSLHKMKRVQLYIDGQQHFPHDIESTNTDYDTYMLSTFLEESGRINSGESAVYYNYNTYPIFAFDLTADKSQNQNGLNLQKSGSARLSIGFENQTPTDYILMVLAYYDQIIEITKDREIVFV